MDPKNYQIIVSDYSLGDKDIVLWFQSGLSTMLHTLVPENSPFKPESVLTVFIVIMLHS